MDKPILISSTSDGCCTFLLKNNKYSYSGIDGIEIPEIRKRVRYHPFKAFSQAQRLAMFERKNDSEWEMTSNYRKKIGKASKSGEFHG